MMFENAYISQPGLTWIAKPTARAQGKGIFLINDLRDVKDWKKANLPVKKKEPDPFAKPKKVKPLKEGEEAGLEAADPQKKELSRPCQIGHEYEYEIPFDVETIAAARCWMDCALCQCWTP
jgi:hypothetical protein